MDFDKAIQHLAAGRLQQAQVSCNRLLRTDPNHPDALHWSGLIAFQLGNLPAAFNLINSAIENNPQAPQYHNNLGLVLESLGKLTEAIQAYRNALQLHPAYADAYNNLGNALKEIGRLAEAIVNYQKALQLNPVFAEAHFNLAIILYDQGHLEAAVCHYKQALRLKPGYIKAYNNLGNALKDLGRIDEAIQNYTQALHHDPEYVSALNNLGIGYRAQGRIKEAVEVFVRAVKCQPNLAGSYCNLANALKDQNRFESALKHYRRAIRLKPDFAEAHFNCAIIHLLMENFEAGWQEYEWRLQRPEWRRVYDFRINLPRWDGQSFCGRRLLVFGEQGFGDTLQFVRYLPLVKARGGTVIFETRRPLLNLFKELAGVDELVERSAQTGTTTDADFCVPLLSLPGIFKTRLETIPAEVPYLSADDSKKKLWQKRFAAKGINIGLVWAGSTTDPNRICPLRQFSFLSGIPGINIYGLQKGDPADLAENSTISNDLQLINFGRELRDFADTAAVIANLDLVISIDTAVAHLAGAMGKPVWILLPYVCDWRWLLKREDSPWYPTMRLFRQKTRGDWDEVTHRMAQQLAVAINKLEGGRQIPKAAEKLYRRGNWLYDQNHYKKAILSYEQALNIYPEFFAAYFNLAKAFQEIGNYKTAITYYQRSLELQPDFFEAFYNLGVVLQMQKKFKDAIYCYQKVVDLKPDFYQAYQNLGTAFQGDGNFAQAISSYRKALELKPDSAEIHYNMGRAYHDCGEATAAIRCYRAALELKGDYTEAHHNIALTFYMQGKFDEAMACYRKVLQLKPDHLQAHYNLGNLFRERGDYDGMIRWYEKALRIEPDSPETHYNLAVAYRSRNKIDRAIDFCEKALRLNPEFDEAFAYRVQLLQHACSWQNAKTLSDRLDELTKQSVEKGKKTAEQPMLNLRRHTNPALNFAVAHSWSRDLSEHAAKIKWDFSRSRQKSPGDKITVGYLSADFKNHAVMHLMLGLFRSHSRQKFRIICYSHGKDDGSPYRHQIKELCDHFFEIESMSDLHAAGQIYRDRVDILVDLMGHTRGNRLKLCALRPAPIQASYLGFLGTTGADFMDYYITDRICTPADQTLHYSEKFAYLPHCYQVNDHLLEISDKRWRKADFGLPSDGFLFCSFNQPYKIDQIMFDAWMRILRRVPQSILWLLDQNPTATHNLQRRAQAVGVEPSRLFFARGLPLAEHLARLRLADLALDTRIYNGGATTSNALWSGAPVITLQGEHFVSRMSSSSLTAVGLPELITYSVTEYEDLAVDLATERKRLEAVRKKLARNRLTYPLFDTSRFALNLEEVYQTMWHIFAGGGSPKQIEVVEKP